MAATTFPPSARDFHIYQRITLEGATTRQSATDFSLSQTRVRQIVTRVTHWLAESLPPSCEATDAAYLRLAQHIAADRLQFLYGEAMRGWRATQESKYAGVLLRVTAAMGKMPVSAGTLDALLADALEGPLPDDYLIRADEAPAEPAAMNSKSKIENPKSPKPPAAVPQSAIPGTLGVPPSAIPSPPPPGDCSSSAEKPSALATSPAAQPTAIPAAATTSDRSPDDRVAARRAFLAPAQQQFGAGLPTLPKPPTAGLPRVNEAPADSAITELNITPQSLGLSFQRKLSRRERRKLRRKIGR